MDAAGEDVESADERGSLRLLQATVEPHGLECADHHLLRCGAQSVKRVLPRWMAHER